MKLYCKSCGKANEYIGNKPSFCGFCGENMSSIKITKQTATSQIRSSIESAIPKSNPFLGKVIIKFDNSDITGDYEKQRRF